MTADTKQFQLAQADQVDPRVGDLIRTADNRAHEDQVNEFFVANPDAPSREEFDYPEAFKNNAMPDPEGDGFGFLPADYYKSFWDRNFSKPISNYSTKTKDNQFDSWEARVVATGVRGFYRTTVGDIHSKMNAEVLKYGEMKREQEDPAYQPREYEDLLSESLEKTYQPFRDSRINEDVSVAGAAEQLASVAFQFAGPMWMGGKVFGTSNAINLAKGKSAFKRTLARMEDATAPNMLAGEYLYARNPESEQSLVKDTGIWLEEEWGMSGPMIDAMKTADDTPEGKAVAGAIEGMIIYEGLRTLAKTGVKLSAPVLRKAKQFVADSMREMDAVRNALPVSMSGVGGKVSGKVKNASGEPVGINERIDKYATPEEADMLNSKTVGQVESLLESSATPAEVAAMSAAGGAKRGWYRASVDALRHVFGEDAERFAGLLSATSPQTSVESNLRNALNVWKNWTKQGRPTDDASIIRIMGESVEGTKGADSVMDAWKNNTLRALKGEGSLEALSGPKVDSFMRNLAGFFNEVTQDTWMARGTGLSQSQHFSGRNIKGSEDAVGKVAIKGPGYIAGNMLAREAAEIMSKRTGDAWTPAEVQETVWSWVKTIYEARGAKGETRSIPDILKSGDITDDMIQDTPDFATMFGTKGEFHDILKDAGYGQQLDNLPASDFGKGKSVSGGAEQGRDLESAAQRLESTARRADDAAAEKAVLAKQHKDITKLYSDTIARPSDVDGGRSRAFGRRTGRSRGTVLKDTPHTTYSLPKEAQSKFNAHGIPTPALHEFDNPKAFHDAITQAKASQDTYGGAVHIYSEAEYKDMRTFVTADGSAGFAIKPDGDIVSVFNTRGGRHKSVGPHMVALAVEQGGTKLDAFNIKGMLQKMYSTVGLKKVKELKWDDQYAPDDWDYKALRRPKVIFMELKK